MKRFLFVCLFLALALPAQAASKVAFCRPDNMASALAFIADEQGYFKAEGLDLTYATATNGKICQDNLIAGKGDAMMGGDGPFTYLSFTPTQPIRLIAQQMVNPETALIARRDRGIEKESDIKGKRIGYLPGTVSYIYTAHLLEKLGLTPQDVHLVALQPPAMPQALQGGAIDGFVMWEPWVSQAVKALGNGAVWLHDPLMYNYRSVFSVTQSFAKNHPEDIKAMLRALLRAEAYIHAHPAEARVALARDAKLDVQILEKNWSAYVFRLTLDPSLIALLDSNARYITRDDPNFKDKPAPDFRKFIDSSFLRVVAPDRVEAGM